MKRNKAFTLIELLVVIAIIGILASVLMSGITAARQRLGKGSSGSGTSATPPNARRATDVFESLSLESGDKVEIPGVATGVVNKVNGTSVEVLIRNPNGEVSVITVQRDALKKSF